MQFYFIVDLKNLYKMTLFLIMVLLVNLNMLSDMNSNTMVQSMFMLFYVWVQKKNVERIMNEIIASITTTLNENTSKFIETTNSM